MNNCWDNTRTARKTEKEECVLPMAKCKRECGQMIVLSVNHMFVGITYRIYVKDYPKVLHPLKNIALSLLIIEFQKVKFGHPMFCSQANILLGFHSSISSSKRDL